MNFLNLEKKINSDILEVHNRPIYIKDFSGSVTSTGIVIGIYGIMQALLQLLIQLILL